jgi:hypothetical protein
MKVGKTLFAQIMKFVPWTSFGRIVDRYAKLLCTGHLTITRVAAAQATSCARSVR